MATAKIGGSNEKRVIFAVKILPSDRARIKRMADKQYMSMSAFVYKQAMAEVERLESCEGPRN